jgi:peptidoglycan/LPS O-acetylase OafA/YrhL
LLAVLSVRQREAGIDSRWARHPDLAWLSWGASLFTFWFLSIGFGLDDHRGQVNFSLAQEWWLLLLWGVVGVTAVMPAVFGAQDAGWIRRFLRLRVMTWLGLLSYGIYLWHEAAIDWYLRNVDGTTFRLPALELTGFMLAVSIAIAAASYYVVERPALRLKSRPITEWFARRPGQEAR